VPRAVGLTDELLANWAPAIKGIQLIPSSGGRFEVILDGDLIYSKATLKRHAEPGEVARLVEERIGPPLPRD
jgi:selenoprotein W-related protein